MAAPTPVRSHPAPRHESDHDARAIRTDRQFYAELWGSTPAGRRRIELIEQRRVAAMVAIAGAMVLAILLLAG